MRLWIHLTACALALGSPAAALAQGAATPAPASSPADPAPQALAIEELGKISGGQSITAAITEQTLGAVSTGNSIRADSVRSGDINFSAGALNNFAGVGNFVTNTGNNNILQGNLSVTVIAAPGALPH